MELRNDTIKAESGDFIGSNAAMITALRRRRRAVARHPTLLGLDYVNVRPDGDSYKLFLHFVPSEVPDAQKRAVPSGISPAKVFISDYEGHSAVSDLLITDVVVGQWERRIDSIIESVLTFDGSASIDCGNRIDLADKSFSIEFWARRNPVNGDQIVLGQGPVGRHLALTVGFNRGEKFIFAFTGDVLEVDAREKAWEWHHWACVYDAAPRRQTVYRDGVKVGQRCASSHFRGGGPFILGAGPEGSFFFGNTVAPHSSDSRVWNLSRTEAINSAMLPQSPLRFEGQLGEVRIWDRVLLEDDIKCNMYQRIVGNEPRLVAYWNSVDLQGRLVDRSGRGNGGRSPGCTSETVADPPSPPGYISRRRGSGIDLYRDGDVLSISVRRTKQSPEEREVARFRLTLPGVDNLDPFFSAVTFDLKCEGEYDPAPLARKEIQPVSTPDIDYLTRDYQSFRQMLLDRMSSLAPAWSDRSAADMGVALAEALAFAADQLSYFQDAVATEAYLGTARRRISVARHARLIDYRMHNGCNARAFVHVQVDRKLELDRGTLLATRLPGCAPSISPDTLAEETQNADCNVFETMHRVSLNPENNSVPFYTWGGVRSLLRMGETRATLLGSLQNICPGDVLIFQEVKGAETGLEDDADPSHRHAVRLKSVRTSADALGELTGEPVSVTEIEWVSDDALPFDLHLEIQVGRRRVTGLCVALGNIVLADHGATVTDDTMPAVPGRSRYSPRLERSNLTFSEPYDHQNALTVAAKKTLIQSPRDASPDARLYEHATRHEWGPVFDFYFSDRFSRCFVVEIEADKVATLRFGNGKQGRRPSEGTRFRAVYRVGNGTEGNIGREAIAHAVTERQGIVLIRNPMSAMGGIDFEAKEEVKLRAPQLMKSQERCVTASDYADKIAEHPEVSKSAAEMRWTGSWYTATVAVTRRGDAHPDQDFCYRLREYMERFRVAGADVCIVPPRYVPLDIALRVRVSSGYYPSSVEHLLRKRFSNEAFQDGTRGFFHPENFTFGQSIYLSNLTSEARTIPGVEDVEVMRLQRWGRLAEGRLPEGALCVSPLEIVRLDNNVQAPGNGRIVFELVMPRVSSIEADV